MVKCACGCGQDVVGPVVGVPTGEGDFIAFIPEHHMGPKVAAEGEVSQDNPKRRVQVSKLDEDQYWALYSHGSIVHDRKTGKLRYSRPGDLHIRFPKKNPVYVGRTATGTLRSFYSRKKPKGAGYVLLYGPFKDRAKAHRAVGALPRRNALPIGKIAQLAGVKGRISIGENPIEKCWRCGKPFKQKGTEVACPSCHREMTSGMGWSTGPQIKNPSFLNRQRKDARLAVESLESQLRVPRPERERLILQRHLDYARARFAYLISIGEPSRNADDGTIAVHGSEVEEIRYIERGTGIRYKHKFKRGKIKVKRGKIEISPATVAPEGIVS
jgi:uncharacterized Zn finger protein (UPF0148 family)